MSNLTSHQRNVNENTSIPSHRSQKWQWALRKQVTASTAGDVDERLPYPLLVEMENSPVNTERSMGVLKALKTNPLHEPVFV